MPITRKCRIKSCLRVAGVKSHLDRARHRRLTYFQYSKRSENPWPCLRYSRKNYIQLISKVKIVSLKNHQPEVQKGPAKFTTMAECYRTSAVQLLPTRLFLNHQRESNSSPMQMTTILATGTPIHFATIAYPAPPQTVSEGLSEQYLDFLLGKHLDKGSLYDP